MGQTLDTIPELDNDFGVTTKGELLSLATCFSVKVDVAVFIRGLYTAWSRASPDNVASKLIEGFIMVQVSEVLFCGIHPAHTRFSVQCAFGSSTSAWVISVLFQLARPSRFSVSFLWAIWCTTHSHCVSCNGPKPPTSTNVSVHVLPFALH